jgi:hypothetical protein
MMSTKQRQFAPLIHISLEELVPALRVYDCFLVYWLILLDEQEEMYFFFLMSFAKVFFNRLGRLLRLSNQPTKYIGNQHANCRNRWFVETLVTFLKTLYHEFVIRGIFIFPRMLLGISSSRADTICNMLAFVTLDRNVSGVLAYSGYLAKTPVCRTGLFTYYLTVRKESNLLLMGTTAVYNKIEP